MNSKEYNVRLMRLTESALTAGEMDITQVLGGLESAKFYANRMMEEAAKQYTGPKILTPNQAEQALLGKKG